MRHKRRIIFAVMMPLLILGMTRLIHFHEKLVVSESIRVIDFIGLAVAGASCGVPLVVIIMAIASRYWKPEGPTNVEMQSPALQTSDANVA